MIRKEFIHIFSIDHVSVLNWALSFTTSANEISCIFEFLLHEEVNKEKVDNFVKS